MQKFSTRRKNFKKIFMNLNLIVAETERSFFYIKSLIRAKIKISKIIYFANKKKATYQLIKSKNLLNVTQFIKVEDINSPLLVKKSDLKNLSGRFIYSGYPGQIIKNDDLLRKKLIHCHSGDLPFFKGSTTIYYTLLSKKKICVSLFIMNRNIDEGKIIFKKFFNPPKNFENIEKNFDNEIRSNALIEFLKKKIAKNEYINRQNIKYFYYKAHPILRMIVNNPNNFKKIP